MSPPGFWKAVGIGFLTAPKPSALRAKFGAAGQQAWLVLMLKAQEQFYAELDKSARVPGRVKLAWPEFAHLIGCDVGTAHQILAEMVELDEFVMENLGHGFVGQLRDWTRWEVEPRNPREAAKKREQRAKKKETEEGHCPPGVAYRDRDREPVIPTGPSGTHVQENGPAF